MTAPLYWLEFQVPGLPRMANASGRSRGFWVINNERKQWKAAVAGALAGRKKPDQPLKRAKVTCTRYSSSAPDFDGLVAGFKPIIDALVDLGILEDDSMKHIGVPTFHWEPVKPKQGCIAVTVQEVR
jgi:hypothetical protein